MSKTFLDRFWMVWQVTKLLLLYVVLEMKLNSSYLVIWLVLNRKIRRYLVIGVCDFVYFLKFHTKNSQAFKKKTSPFHLYSDIDLFANISGEFSAIQQWLDLNNSLQFTPSLFAKILLTLKLLRRNTIWKSPILR